MNLEPFKLEFSGCCPQFKLELLNQASQQRLDLGPIAEHVENCPECLSYLGKQMKDLKRQAMRMLPGFISFGSK